MAVALAGAAAFLLWGVWDLPILLWDESRTMVNALEMARSGSWSLVTTYDGRPDLWNTKPPLLIWLMRGSVALFGPGELALRLPGMIASVVTIALAMGFVRRISGSWAAAAVTAALIALSPALFAEHGARTADYDSLLTALTTAYLLLLFGAIHARPSMAWLLGIAALVAAALLTKSIAGVTAGVGVLVYLTLIGRWRRIAGDWRWWAAAGGAVAAVAGFALAREAAAPGYLAAAWGNDVAGRFGHALNDVAQPPWRYLQLLAAGYVAGVPLLLLAPLAWRGLRRRERLALSFALCIAGGLLAVISLSASRLNQYILPAVPFLAMAAALVLLGLVRQLPRLARLPRMAAVAVAAVVLTLATAEGITGRARDPVQSPFAAREAGYGPLLVRLAARTERPVLIVEPGFESPGGRAYAPVLHAYRLIYAARGFATGRVGTVSRAAGFNGVIASCDGPTVAALMRVGRDLAGVSGCRAVRVGAAGRAPPGQR